MSQTANELFSQPVLIAGFGSIGRRHFRNLKELGCSNFVFYRTRRGTIPDDESAAWPTVSELSEIGKLGPLVAIVSNPTSEHVAVALAAVEAGCDLYLEKPVSDRLEGCEELLAAVRRHKAVAMVGCQFRFHPLLAKLRERVHAGDLGTTLGADAEWGEYLPDWHPWEDHRASYSARADLGGGVVLTLIHPLDYMHWMFGEIEHVQAAIRSVPALQTPAGEDWADICLRFRSGVIGRVHLDYVQRPPVHRLRVWGDKGRAELDFHAGRLLLELADGSRTAQQTPPGFERNTMFLGAMRHFLDCVANRTQPTSSLDEGVAVLKTALAVKRSAAETASCA